MTDAPYEPLAPVFTYPEAGPLVQPPPSRRKGSIVSAVMLAIVVTGLGAAVGWIWSEVAPRVAVIKADAGFYYADSEPEQAVAGDGWFAVLGLIVGVVLAILVWQVLRRYRGPILLLGLTVGSLAGAALAWWVGAKIGMTQFHDVALSAANGARLNAPLELRITNLEPDNWYRTIPTGVVVVQALAAAAFYTVLSGFSSDSGLRGDPVPAVFAPNFPPPELTFQPQILPLEARPDFPPLASPPVASLPVAGPPVAGPPVAGSIPSTAGPAELGPPEPRPERPGSSEPAPPPQPFPPLYVDPTQPPAPPNASLQPPAPPE